MLIKVINYLHVLANIGRPNKLLLLLLLSLSALNLILAFNRSCFVIRVLYFTIVAQVDGVQNGGTLSSRTNILRLQQDDNIELAVVVATSEEARHSMASFLEGQGINRFLFVPLQSRFRQGRVRDYLKYRWARIAGFPFEAIAARNPNTKQCVVEALDRWNSDVLIIDYLYSTLFCPDLTDLKLPAAVITLNREAEFFRECVEHGAVSQNPITFAIAKARLRRFERKTYSRAAKVITLGRSDAPTYLASSQVDCITPYLDEATDRWRFSDSRTMFFVGNISHYPNRLAIEFIARRLAPRIAARRDDVLINVIGADAADVPAEWRNPIVSYLGVSDASTVANLFQSSDLFLCPIQNDFGMKFKLAEAVSYATPFLASRESALCVPYLSGLPHIDLSDDEAAADLICRLIGNRPKLERLSESIRLRHRAFVASQKNIWSRVLSGAGVTSAARSQGVSCIESMGGSVP